jgi:hypothetical protein
MWLLCFWGKQEVVEKLARSFLNNTQVKEPKELKAIQV